MLDRKSEYYLILVAIEEMKADVLNISSSFKGYSKII